MFWRLALCWMLMATAASVRAAAVENYLRLPEPGEHTLRVLTPTVLELELVTRKEKDPAPPPDWNFVSTNFVLTLPKAAEFRVTVNGAPVPVASVGFKRRALYAPLKKRDLRLGNWIYLKLDQPIPADAGVAVDAVSNGGWANGKVFKTKAEPHRWSPVIHVNQSGYTPGLPKRAMLGYYLGSLGEMVVPTSQGFQLLDAATGKSVFSGKLVARRDRGFTYPTYQQVAEANFTEFNQRGMFKLFVPGIGVSYPFVIDDGVAAAFTRTYALGLYHQRCGAANALPFTRHVHDACHTAPALIPTTATKSTEQILAKIASDHGVDKRHTAKRLDSVANSLFPFVNQGTVDVSGGHHDAGDYSKYTINSAALVHSLVLAADAFDGAGDLDNLGLPESGDGKSDLLQIAKWETDFLAKMQDADGGFYFLVYPRDRRYEDDVLPNKGDPQVVFPKTTAVTAAAVAALAQTASSPRFKKQFPEEAKRYLTKAQLGWRFLQKALAKHGRDGSYQQITHYGAEFIHDDELVWAATEIFLATGDQQAHEFVLKAFDPNDRETKRWTWWRLYEAYGSTIRSYALAAKSGRIEESALNAEFLGKCQQEIRAVGDDQLRFTMESAYGTAFPDPSKRFRNAGWYFSLDRAFDIATAAQFSTNDSRGAQLLDAVVSNMNYEGGCNPVNVSYLTGLGYKRPRDVVHQYAQNDRRVLPPSGIPIGNIQEGFMFQHHYERELGTLSYPPDGAQDQPYAFYDRWGDSFNTSAEFVIGNQGRGLATLGWLMAQTPAKAQSPTALPQVALKEKPQLAPRISLKDGAYHLEVASELGLDLSKALIVWEAEGAEPMLLHGTESFTPASNATGKWVEAEACWPDGRRIFAALDSATSTQK